MKFIIGQKIGSTRIFQDNQAIPVTLVEVSNNTVLQIKDKKNDGYDSVQVGYKDRKKMSKSVIGHLKKSGLKSALVIKEFRLDQVSDDLNVGDPVRISQFQPGDLVTVIGKSKGKGFSGTVKRHNFTIGPKSHGSNNQRRPGSIGATTPAHVIKGRKMPGRMGHEQITLKNRKIVEVLNETNTLLIHGAIPGAKGTILKILS